jgi:hypothetical protein
MPIYTGEARQVADASCYDPLDAGALVSTNLRTPSLVKPYSPKTQIRDGVNNILAVMAAHQNRHCVGTHQRSYGLLDGSELSDHNPSELMGSRNASGGVTGSTFKYLAVIRLPGIARYRVEFSLASLPSAHLVRPGEVTFRSGLRAIEQERT